ncbi:lytic polysaccharide monooxygenase [Aulographum hederae CBS 113979]|uniref:AA9 family lytic polysaccharide monooxygenase n=1 Tax=Aulographum hederae CBS 113979 TaxID=1176131 RepID=A0A6G1GRM9_9PEZI|nr:lytic polysaccharide monooxygenase [Aulographum hederae CBS 113979]
MKPQTLLALLGSASVAQAHLVAFAAWVNGVDQGTANNAPSYVRVHPGNNPIQDVTSPNMKCNLNGDAPAAKTVKAMPGDKITIEWHHESRAPTDDIIADSHKGPIQVYLAPTASNGNGNVWVKVASETLNNGVWAVDNLIKNKGKHEFVMPKDLAPGKYLVRPEIIALHGASVVGQAQFYMECLQFEVGGQGTTPLPAGVPFPGAYKATDPGVKYDLYTKPKPSRAADYTAPGPAVWEGASA